MRNVIATSLRFRVVVLALAAALIVFGLPRLGDASVDVLPEFTPTIVEVQAEALGLSAEEVEQFVTVPLEQDLLNGVAFLESIESTSMPGLSSVVMTFEPGTDLLDARQVVAERLTQAVGVAGLPHVADPPQMLQPLSALNRVSITKLSSDDLSGIELSVLARWVVVPRLLGVPGVANVAIWGFRDRQLQVLVDPEHLRAHGVTLQHVVRSAGNALEVSPLSFLEASTPGTGGFIDTLNQRLQIFHEQAIRTPEQLAQITIEDERRRAVFVDGEPLALGEVANVVEDHQPLIGDALCQDGTCLLLVVEKFPGADILDVTSGLDAALEALGPGLEGVEVDTSVYRPAAIITTSFGTLARTMGIGLVLALAVLALALASVRSVLIVGVALIASMTAAALALLLLDASMNTMVVAGLVMAVAVVIQDAVEGVTSVAGARGSESSPLRAIVSGTLAVRRALGFGALVAIAVVLPAWALPGAAGAFLPPVALAYAMALVVASLVAVTVVPALQAVLPAGAGSRTRAVERLGARADALTRTALERPRLAVAFVALPVLAGVLALPFLTTSMEPALREPDLLVRLQGQPGTSLAAMDAVAKRAVQRLGSVPGVRGVAAHVGRAITSDRVVNVDSADVWVGLEPGGDHAATTERVRELIDDVAGDGAGFAYSVGTYSGSRVSDVLRETDHDLAVRVYGEDPAVLRASAERVLDRIASIPGVDEPRVDLPAEEPTIEVRADVSLAREHGVKPGDVRRAAAILLSGITVGNLFEDQKVFDVVVWGAPRLRASVSDVRALPIETADGELVPLGEVADVRIVPTPTVIEHESVQTYLDVIADIEGRGAPAVAADVEDAVASMAFPFEYHAAIVGDAADARAARRGAVTMAAIAVVLIALLLQAAVSSWRLAGLLLVMLAAVAGAGVAAVWLGEGTLTLGAAAGLAASVGLAARAFVAGANELASRLRADVTLGPDLAAEATRERFPVLLASLGAPVALFLPALAQPGAMGLEIVRPMAIAVMGGAVGAMALVLTALPAAVLRLAPRLSALEREDDLIITLDEPSVAIDLPEGVR